MINRKTLTIVATTIGFMWLLLGISCEKGGLTRSVDWDDYTEFMSDSIIMEDSIKMDDKSGISFEMESDSLKEDIEDVYFHAKEWGEERINVDL